MKIVSKELILQLKVLTHGFEVSTYVNKGQIEWLRVDTWNISVDTWRQYIMTKEWRLEVSTHVLEVSTHGTNGLRKFKRNCSLLQMQISQVVEIQIEKHLSLSLRSGSLLSNETNFMTKLEGHVCFGDKNVRLDYKSGGPTNKLFVDFIGGW